MIKAIIFDIYGTLLFRKGGDLSDSLSKRDYLMKSFSKLIKEFNLDTNPEELFYLYHKEIDDEHKRKSKRGIKYPEVIIEKIWKRILKKIGYDNSPKTCFDIAFYFDNINSQKKLYPYAAFVLKKLKEKDIRLGIISNAQFYTKIDMLKLLYDKIGLKHLEEIFDNRLTFYSYKLGYSKPNKGAFLKVKERLGKKGIKPSEIMYVGNDVKKDIKTANSVGFKSCLLIENQTKINDKAKPDYKIKDLREIVKIVE